MKVLGRSYGQHYSGMPPDSCGFNQNHHETCRQTFQNTHHVNPVASNGNSKTEEANKKNVKFQNPNSTIKKMKHVRKRDNMSEFQVSLTINKNGS